MKFDKKTILIAIIVIAGISIISLILYPQWRGAWWILLISVIAGVVDFLANFRQAFEKTEEKPATVKHEGGGEDQTYVQKPSGGQVLTQINTMINNEYYSFSETGDGQRKILCAPPQPSLLIGRDEDLARLKERMMASDRQVSGLQVLTAIKGWPGVGKTSVVAALAHDTDIIAHFTDGVLWMSLGQDPDILAKLAYWGKVIGIDVMKQAASIEEAKSLLTGALLDKKILFIIDDVWRFEDVYPFQVGGELSRTLLTTRLEEVAREVAPTPESIYRLPILSESASIQLLRKLAPTVVEQHEQDCLTLVKQLEGLPLALQVAGRLLQAEISYGFGVGDLIRELGEGAALLRSDAPLDRMDIVNQTTPTVAALLQKSVERLDQQTRQRFAYLGVFAPKPATFDVDALAFVWQLDDASQTIKKLVDRGLLEFLPEINRYQMHSLLVMLAKSLLTENE